MDDGRRGHTVNGVIDMSKRAQFPTEGAEMPKPMTVEEAVTFFRAMADVLEKRGDIQSAEAARTLLTAYDASQTVVHAAGEYIEIIQQWPTHPSRQHYQDRLEHAVDVYHTAHNGRQT